MAATLARKAWQYRIMRLGLVVVTCVLVAYVACSRSGGPVSDDKSASATTKHEDRHEPATAKPGLHLEVTIGGQRSTWDQGVFDKVPHFPSQNHDGEARDTWSLRELAHQAVGPSARVVAVIGTERKLVDEAAWADLTRTPILHTTRRGTFKFRWADKAGTWGDTEVKEVVAIEITP